jgi:hypothetical protein
MKRCAARFAGVLPDRYPDDHIESVELDVDESTSDLIESESSTGTSQGREILLEISVSQN